MRPGVVSVVLPIYGVEKYLDRCITSIVNQTYSNLEIILVDDGSRDNCPQMCDDWAEKDSRIKVVHKANAGLGMARNTGIENATGEYICFFDSDDYVALDTVEKAYALAKQESSDLVTFGLSVVDRNGTVAKTYIPQTDKVTYAGDEVQNVFLPDLIATKKNSVHRNLWMSACVSLYSMALIDRSDWRFASEREIISEDVFSLLCLYKYVAKVSILRESLYYYCENEVSLTRTYREDRFEKICYFHETSVKKAQELGYSDEVVNRLMEPFVSFAIAAMKMVVKFAPMSEREKRQQLRQMLNGYMRKLSWKTGNVRLGRKLFEFCMEKRLAWACYLLIKLADK